MFFDISAEVHSPAPNYQGLIDAIAREVRARRGRIVSTASGSLEFRSPFLNWGLLQGVTFGNVRSERQDAGFIVYYRLSIAPTRYLLILYIVVGIVGGAAEGNLFSVLIAVIAGPLFYQLNRVMASILFRRLVRRAATLAAT